MPNLSARSLQKITGVQCPHWSTALIWALGVVAMLGLTVKDLHPLLSEYFDNDQNALVKISVQKNDTLKPPELHLCMPFMGLYGHLDAVSQGLFDKAKNRSVKCEKCEKLANHSWDVWTEKNWTDPDFSGGAPLSALFIRKLFSNTSDNSLKFWWSTEWNTPIIDAILHYFYNFILFDSNFFRNSLTNKTVFPDMLRHFPEDTRKQNLLYDRLLEFLCARAIGWRARHPDGRYKILENSTCSQHLKISATSLQRPLQAATHNFCFKLPTYVGAFEFVSGRIIDVFKVSGYYNLFSENPLFNPGSELYKSPYHVAGNLDLTVKYSIQMNVVENRDDVLKYCYKENTKAECVLKCKTANIQKYCACVPFNSRFYGLGDLDAMHYCNDSDYVDCAIEKSTKDSEEACSNQCDTACEYTSYQWQFYATTQAGSNTFRMNVVPVASPYIQFTVNVKDTPQCLITQLGGLLNFYLGWSGLSMIVIILYVIDCCKRWKRVKSETRATQQPIFFPSGLYWRWMELTASAALKQETETEKNDSLGSIMGAMQLDMQNFKQRMDGLADKLEEEKREIQTLKSEICKRDVSFSHSIVVAMEHL